MFAITFAMALLAGALVARPAGAGDLKSCEQEFQRVVKAVRPSVVTVIAYSSLDAEAGIEPHAGELKKSVGSGIVLNPDGHILTTTSVVGRSRNLFVRTAAGVERPAVFLGADYETALALLKVKPDGLEPAHLGRPNRLEPGGWAIIVAESENQFPSFTFGAFTHVATGGEAAGDASLLQMSAQVYPGNTGGAVANSDGEVVGVILGAMSGAPKAGRAGLAAGGQAAAEPSFGPTLSLAIPIDLAEGVAAELAAHGSLAPGYLGVRVRMPTEALRDLLQFDAGVIILEVLSGSPAQSAAIEVGDVILSFDGTPVRHPSELARLVAAARPGERRVVSLKRGDVPITRMVTVGAAPIGGDVDRHVAEEERRRIRRRILELRRELAGLESRLESP